MTSNEPVIIVEDVYKQYLRQHQRISFRHDALVMIKNFVNPTAIDRQQSTGFYALQGVSFSINAGETVAIIGRNGAGKTTLLRLLCKVTRPTRGKVSLFGRFIALIGLGTGFNMELTGRQNVYLNACIFGMKPKDVDGIIDSVIEFSELGEFIDVPVKTYSSGMNSRLGFSIAIHVVPDIILLDEVLAVGDAAFRQKCEKEIYRLKNEGRTLILVTHSATAVADLCERCIWIHEGKLIMDGPTEPVLKAYNSRFNVKGRSIQDSEWTTNNVDQKIITQE